MFVPYLVVAVQFSQMGVMKPQFAGNPVSLDEVAQDLESAAAADGSQVNDIENQIVQLARKRDHLKEEQARKLQEVTLIREMSSGKMQIGSTAAVPAVTNATQDVVHLTETAGNPAPDFSRSENVTVTSQDTAKFATSVPTVSSEGPTTLGETTSLPVTASHVMQMTETEKAALEAKMEADAEAHMRAQADARAKLNVEQEHHAQQQAAEKEAAKKQEPQHTSICYVCNTDTTCTLVHGVFSHSFVTLNAQWTAPRTCHLQTVL